MSKDRDSVLMKELQRSNSVDGEIYVDAPSTPYATMYINHGFDNEREEIMTSAGSTVSRVAVNDSSSSGSSPPSKGDRHSSGGSLNNQMCNIPLTISRQHSASVKLTNSNNNRNVTFGSTIIPISNNNSIYEKNSNSPGVIDSSNSMKEKLSHPGSFSAVATGSTSLIWNDLSFEVLKKVWKIENGMPVRRTTLKQILKPQNGEIYSGSLTALMGPSGAGKSTLLNCLTGRYVTGVKGDICITCRGSKPKANISFVPQKDDLFMTFTVRETLVFASKMKNLSSDTNHEDEAMRVMKNLNLECCRDVKVSKCSGGQVKRVCIAVELISNPDILVLDEPTTGLDSSTAAQCVELLRRLIESKSNPPAIVATIHQPNYKIFQEFTSVYLLSRNGQNVYHGPPSKIVDYFSRYNLICPTYCNPADYAIEVAYGDYGQEVFSNMETDNRLVRYTGEGRGTKYDLRKVIFKLRKKKMPSFTQTLWLIKRNWQHMMRDSNQFWFKNIFSIAVAFLIAYLWVYKVGEDDGCWEAFNSPINQTELKDNLFKINVTAAKDEYLTKISRMADNSALIFAVNIYVMMISLISCVLSFPLETSIILKEIGNNWYKPSSYFWAKVIADIPPMVLGNMLLLMIVYPMTGQIPEVWRFLIFFLIICLVAEVCQTFGTCMGILMSSDIISAALVTTASSIPVIIFAGFLVRYSGMPWYFRPLSYVSYMRYAFEGLLITIYGFDRCASGSGSENFVEKLVNSQDPQKIVRNIWKSMNVTYNDVKRFSHLLNVDEECLGEVTNNTADYMGLEYHSPFPTTTTPSPWGFSFSDEEEDSLASASPSNDNPSYILSYYELHDWELWGDITCLIVYSLIFKICIYLLLKYKTRTTV